MKILFKLAWHALRRHHSFRIRYSFAGVQETPFVDTVLLLFNCERCKTTLAVKQKN